MKAFLENKWVEFNNILAEKHGKNTYSYIQNIRINNLTKIQCECERCHKLFIIQYINYKKLIKVICKTCKTKETNLIRYNKEFISQVEGIKNKKVETYMKKYGVKNPSQSKQIKEKIKHNNLEKYGVESYVNIEKKKKTNLERYGFENSLQNKDVINKKKKTNLEKYGCESPLQNNDIKEKIKQTNLKKYGYIYAIQSNSIKEKIKQTNLKKYGYESVLQSRSLINKIKQNNLKKYGFIRPTSTNEIKEKMKSSMFLHVYNNILCLDNVNPLFSLEEYKQIRKDKYSLFKWKCKKCGNEFEDYYANGIEPRCLECFPKLSNYSDQEKEISDYCKSLGLEIIENNRSIISPYEIDIYLPDYKLGIEYNGIYWHSTKFIKDKYYHQNKVKLANEKGIRLLHIWEHEWEKDRQECLDKIQYYIDNLQEEIKIKEPKLYNINDNLLWI